MTGRRGAEPNALGSEPVEDPFFAEVPCFFFAAA